jgi:hypothetical protein
LYGSCEDPRIYRICCIRGTLPSQSSSVYSATRRLRVEAPRLQGNRNRISKQHGPATSLANVDPSPQLGPTQMRRRRRRRRRGDVLTNIISFQK